jgi:hypothetical protein
MAREFRMPELPQSFLLLADMQDWLGLRLRRFSGRFSGLGAWGLGGLGAWGLGGLGAWRLCRG